ncbi:MAG: heparinase II/III family protein, partial [Phycisphaerae bacterium]
MTRPLRYPVGCETSFETAAGRAAKHPHLAEALQILEGLAGRLERLPAEIPADVPDLTGGPQTWSIGTVARRAAGGLVGLFRGDPQRLWPGLIEHLQHLLHVVRAGTGPDNATGGAVLLAGSCLLADHPWARLWAMAGSLRMAAWLQSPGPQAGPAELKDWLAAAATIASRLPELCPALPAGAATVLAERIGRPIEPAAGLFSMQPSDGQLAELLGRSPEEAATAYASRIRQLRDDRLAGEALAGPAEPDRGELEEICRNVLTLRAHMHIKHDFGQRIDWSTVLNGDIESNVSLNHHGHIRALADGYAAYDQQSYADHAVRLLRSWFDQSACPAVRGELQWRTLEVGNRLIDAWPAIAARLIDYPAFARSCLVDLIRWSLASARYLCVFAGPWNNWLQVECAGGLMATALLAE